MTEIDISNLNNIPLTTNQLSAAVKEIYKEVDTSILTDENQINFPYLFAPTHTTDLAEGFEIEVIFRKEPNTDNIMLAISKFVIFDNEDEWHDAFKRIKDLKDT